MRLNRHFLLRTILPSILLLIFLFLIHLPMMSTELTPRGGDNAQYYLRALAMSQGLGYVALESVDANGYGTGISAFAPAPLVPILIAPALRIFGESVAVAKVMFYLLEWTAVLLMLISLRRFVGDYRSGLIVMLFLTNWLIVRYLFQVINTDVIFCGAVMTGLSLFCGSLDSKKSTNRSWLLLGLGFGLLVWLRYGGITWLGAATIWLLVRALRSRTRRNDYWKNFLSFTAGATAAVLALVTWISIQAPTFFREYLGHHAASRNDGSEVTGLLAWGGRILERIAVYVHGLDLFVPGDKYFGTIGLVFVLLFLFLILTAVWRQRRLKQTALIIAFAGFHMLPYLISSSYDYRYLLPIIPLAWILAIRGADEWRDIIQYRFSKLPKLPLSFILLLVTVILFSYSSIRFSHQVWIEGRDSLFTEKELNFRTACFRLEGKYPVGTILVSDRSALQKCWNSYSTISLPLYQAREPAKYLGSFLDQVQRSDQVLAIQDTIQIESPHQIFIDRWLAQDSAFKQVIFTVGEYKVYQIDVSGIRAQPKSNPLKPS